jgi:ribose 5-phosphate isomerase
MFWLQVVGVGSGSTVVYAVQRLADRVKQEGLILRLGLKGQPQLRR